MKIKIKNLFISKIIHKTTKKNLAFNKIILSFQYIRNNNNHKVINIYKILYI